MLFLSLTTQAVATSPPEYWLSSQYQALRNGRQRLLRPPTCGGLSNPVVNAAFRCPGEAVFKRFVFAFAMAPLTRVSVQQQPTVLSFAISRVGKQQELAHDSGDRHLRWLAGAAQLAVLPGEVGVT